MAVAFGPFVGFFTSFQCLSVYVDFYRVDEESIPTDPRDPRWIGAWWLGFVIASVVIVMVSVPLFLFPRKLRKYKCTCCKRSSNNESDDQFSMADMYKADLLQDNKKGIISNIKGVLHPMEQARYQRRDHYKNR
ncbi:solute carrier organic anion transporter family member 2A1-like [Anneissia japonica]|uniref:solute carrier organic anion transporter family member 2A1-like n=1 Tax=Anneissia japonica TaxID=1529436 RepID=UPI001425A080|nr:solute carrier organic anion transporter family member 2A1-like [Anneissia japonica]